MRIVNFEQGSEEWLKWRRSLLTATDAAMLLGLSPYVTPYKGWQRKLGLAEEQKTNAAMERGHRDEPIARALFIEEFGINMTPCCVESDDHNFIGASLDGLSDCGEIILEIKSQRPVEKIPDLHMMQMQHQMLSTDKRAKKAFYVSHWEGVNTTFEAFPDPEWVANYLPKAAEFWKGVLFFEPPAMTDKDYKLMNDSLSWNNLADQYRTTVANIKALEDKKDFLRKEIIKLCNDENCTGGGIKALRKVSKGRVDYEELLGILNISEATVNQYRKPSSSTWTILLDK